MKPLDTLSRSLRFLAWPLTLGLLVALLYLQLKTPVSAPAANPVVAPSHNSYAHSYADAVERAIPSVVNIYTRTRVRQRSPYPNDPLFNFFFNAPQQERVQASLGSGVIVTRDGYLLTNHHVVQGADTIIVVLHDGRESLAKVVGSDAEIDLCVLKIDLQDLTPVSFGNVDNARIGDVVLAIGNPYGLGQTVTQGIISASSRDGLQLTTNYIQTDAAINPGNSGGALIDAQGNLLGINTSIFNTTGSSIGIGFAIPADTAMQVLEDIKTYGRVLRGALGIVPKSVPEKLAKQFNLAQGEGILITAIYSGSPAHQAGLMPGDIIVKMDGRDISGDSVGLDFIAKSKPGKETTVTVVRNGHRVTQKITPTIRAEK
jgi:serine protease DegS